MSIYESLQERYESGQVTWDQELPPPEVMETLAGLTPGHGLDLGCGYGRACLYMAKLGWQVDGVDFIPQAVAEATRRVEAANLTNRVRVHQSPVADLGYLSGPYDFVLDVGCMHVFDEVVLRPYRDELQRLIRPGGLYLLFAHLHDEKTASEDDEINWLEEKILLSFFSPERGFSLKQVERGITQVEDNPPWPSAWYWFLRDGRN